MAIDTQLLDFVQNTYGPGNYLTTSKVRWQESLELTPCPALSTLWLKKAGRPPADGLWTREGIQHGAASFSFGHYAIDGELLPRPYDRAFLYGVVIKKPGEDVHHLPPELDMVRAPTQAFINYNYAASPYTTDKIFAISLRVLRLNVSFGQLGDTFHIHKPPMSDAPSLKRAHFMGMRETDIEAFAEVSQNLIQSEAYYSNRCGTLLQTEPAEEPIKAIERAIDYGIENDEPPPHRQLTDWELAAGNGLTYHASAQIPPEQHGLVRLFYAMAYFPTEALENKYTPDLRL